MHNGYAWLRENLLPYSYGLAEMLSARGDVSDRGKVIPAVKKSRIGMQLADENNPCGTKERNMDESGRRK